MSPSNNAGTAEQTIDTLTGLMERLRGLLEQEATLVRAGRLREAAALGATKATLAGELAAGGERVKAIAKSILQAVPERCAALKSTQEELRAVLQRNMIVLATAHAVSEGIVRRLSGDLAHKATPQVYGATGRTVAPNPRYGRPLAISRTL
jgi:flagellar biosynthesis/type III secretory pathway chaperone